MLRDILSVSIFMISISALKKHFLSLPKGNLMKTQVTAMGGGCTKKKKKVFLVSLWRIFIPLQQGPFLSVGKKTCQEGSTAGTQLGREGRSGQRQLLSSEVTARDGKTQAELQTFHLRQNFMC